MITCTRCGWQNPSGSRFCGNCGAAVAPPAPEPTARKVVSVVFCDWVDSTELGERFDAEAVRQVQLRFFGAMRAAIERHGGTVGNYVGDEIIAVFGIPVAREDDAFRAVRAAVSMREALARLNRELEVELGIRLRVRASVNTGEVVLSDPPQVEAFATGNTLNVAKRIESAAAPDEILLGAETYALVRGAVRAEAVAPIRAKGKTEPVRVWRLLAAAAEALATEGSPLVGRRDELARLRAALDRAHSGGAQLVTLVGPPGIGKSRLIRSFETSLVSSARVVRGRCLPYGEGISDWPIAEVIRQGCGIAPADSADEARAKIAGALPPSDERDVLFAYVAGVVDLGEPAGRAEETFWAIRKLFEGLARERPLVVVLEDVHWAQPMLFDLVDHVVASTKEAGILLLCAARPELEEKLGETWQRWTASDGRETIVLERLGFEDGARMIENLLDGMPVGRDAALRLVEATDGNPLFLEAMLRMLIEEGALRHDGRQWIPAVDLTEVPVPPTVRAVLTARLDQLPTDERTVLEAGSVAGKSFFAATLRALVAEPVAHRLDALLAELERREFIVRADGGEPYGFQHILIRDVVYDSVPKLTRAHLHERVAQWIEQAARDRLLEYEEILGYHLEAAFRLREQLRPLDDASRALAAEGGLHLGRAGRKAVARGDMPAAVKLLDRALSLQPVGAPETVDAMFELGVALMEVGNPRASVVLKRAAAAATSAGDERTASYARIQRLGLLVDRRPRLGTQVLLDEVQRALPVFERAGDDIGLAKAWHRVGFVHGVAGRWEAAREAFERAREHARRGGGQRDEGLASLMLFSCYVRGRTPAELGIELCLEILQTARRYRSVEATGLAAVAMLHAMRDRIDEARLLIAQSSALFDDLGQTRRRIEAAFLAAGVEQLAGDLAAAERLWRWALDEAAKTGATGYRASAAAALADVLAVPGSVREAEALVDFAARTAGEDDVFSQIRWRTARTKLHVARGELEEAERVARQAVARAAETDELNTQAATLVDLARVLRAEGVDGAAEAERQALALYEMKGNLIKERQLREAAVAAAPI
jgi:class 3 adenylate cyclase/tetratricopeptide (TPR) repeat protein